MLAGWQETRTQAWLWRGAQARPSSGHFHHLSGLLRALQGWLRPCKHGATTAATRPSRTSTVPDPQGRNTQEPSPKLQETENGKSLKRQTPAPRADCSCTVVIPRAWRSSPHISHYSTALDVIKPRETSKPDVTKPFVQTRSLCIENILKQFLIKLASS